MTPVLKVGQRPRMSEAEVELFAHQFFSAATEYVGEYPETFTITLAEKTVQVWLNEKDALSSHIRNAFIPGNTNATDFTLEIWRTSPRSQLPNLGWAREYLAHDNLVPASLTNPYRVAFDKSQGFIYLYDRVNKRGAIWIAEDAKISLNSLVTPFRIIFSWMAESFGGEVIHASAISKNGKGLIINGPSGSGKSTLALLCALDDFDFIADDVVLYHDGLIWAIYRYAKVDPNQLGDKFVACAKVDALILPIFAHLNQHAPISPAIAIKLLAPNSLRELMGGTPYNFKNLVDLTRHIPSYRIALSTDNIKNVSAVNSILAELL